MINKISHLIIASFLACLSLSTHAAGQMVEGEVLTIPSPDNTVIKDLNILGYRGLPVLGIHSFAPNKKQFSRPQLVAKFKIDAARIYSDLMRLKLATSKPNKQRLKDNYKGGGSQSLQYNAGLAGEIIEDRAWYKLIANLASASMTTEAYTKYMCKDTPCSRTDLKGQNNGLSSAWGGILANQFESRRAFNSFIDTELDKYIAWAGQLDAEPEAYFVGQARLSPYIFDKGGFAVKINPVGGSLPTTGENLGNLPVFTSKTENWPGVFIKINEAEAEKIVERIHRKQVFFVYKAKLTVADQSYNQQTKQLDFNRLLFNQTITSDVIEVFVGAELQDKLFDIPL